METFDVRAIRQVTELLAELSTGADKLDQAREDEGPLDDLLRRARTKDGEIWNDAAATGEMDRFQQAECRRRSSQLPEWAIITRIRERSGGAHAAVKNTLRRVGKVLAAFEENHSSARRVAKYLEKLDLEGRRESSEIRDLAALLEDFFRADLQAKPSNGAERHNEIVIEKSASTDSIPITGAERKSQKRPGPTPNAEGNRAVARVVEKHGDEWEARPHELAEDLDRLRISVPSKWCIDSNKRDWQKAAASDPANFKKAIKYRLKWTRNNPI